MDVLSVLEERIKVFSHVVRTRVFSHVCAYSAKHRPIGVGLKYTQQDDCTLGDMKNISLSLCLLLVLLLGITSSPIMPSRRLARAFRLSYTMPDRRAEIAKER